MPVPPSRTPAGEPPAVPERRDLGATDQSIHLMLSWFAAYGDTYRVRLLLGNGIMTSEGESWRRQRRVTQDASRVALEVALQAIFSDDLGRMVADLADNPFMTVTRESKRDPGFAYEFRQLGRVVQRILRRRRDSGRRQFDFTQLLMESVDPDTHQGMNEHELLDEILTLVVAGHETTASPLSWTWWLLAQHQAAQERVQAENDHVGELGEAAYVDLDRLTCSRAVLQEALRLYPPGWLLTRRSIGPDRLSGYVLPPGTDVFLSPFVVHRRPAIWDNAQTFEPDRFGPGREKQRPTLAYLPFGAGPRHCIGQNFSMLEMLLHFNGAARRFHVRRVVPGPVALEARINLRPAQDVYLQVEKR